MNRTKRILLLMLTVTVCIVTRAQLQSNLSYRRFTTNDRLPQMQTETVWQDARGYIYIGTLSGFVRYDGRLLTPFLGGRREAIVGFQELWGDQKHDPRKSHVRAMGFVRQWDIRGDDLTLSVIDPLGHLLLNNFNAADLPPGYLLLEDKDEQNRVLCHIDADGIHRVMEHPLLDKMTPDRKLYIDGNDIYVPTPEGLFLISASGNRESRYEERLRVGDQRSGMRGTLGENQRSAPTGKANSFVEGEEGNLVPRTSYHVPRDKHLAPREKLLSHRNIFSLIRSGETLYALADDGIYTIAGDGLKQLYEYHFEAPDYGLFVRQNRQGQLIIADSHTIWLYEPSPHGGDKRGAVTQLATGFNLIKSIFIDSWNRLWAATYQGAYCFFYCDFFNHRLDNHNDIVRAVASCGNHLVMGTLNGTLIVDGQTIDRREDNFYAPCSATVGDKVYLVGNGDIACVENMQPRWLGLPADKYMMVAAFEGMLAIGTRSSILMYNPADGQLETLSEEVGRPWCAADDGQGRLWVSGNQGLYCFSRGVKEEGSKGVKVRATQGSQVVTAMSSDGKGNVVFALGDSLFAIDSGHHRLVEEVMPRLAGHEIRAVHLSPRGYLVVAAIDGLLVARYSAGSGATDIHWFDQENGFTMIEPLKATMAETADGTVWLCGLEEMTSFRPADLLADNQQQTVIEAPRPWWQRWWAWLIAVGVLTIVVWWTARWFHLRKARRRMAHLLREKKQKELQLRAVRLKAIPHFHANVLASIEYFVMNNSADEASHYLKLYSDFTNRTLSDIDRPARSVQDEVDYVRAYLELEQLRYGDRLQYDIRIADDVDQNAMLPTMLLHTFTQNAVKHGIAGKKGQGNILIAVSRQKQDGADGFLVAVSDNGVGRTEAALSNSGTSRQGLKILQQQIELYNSVNRHHIVQHVSDLTDDDGQPAGTRFEIWIPADYQYRTT